MNKKLGVIVGRFQTPYLHEGHKKLIDTAIAENDIVLIMIACKKDRESDERNPYNYNQRKLIISQDYRNMHFGFIKDHESDEYWSNQLDESIERPNHDITLYHSRDSFKEVYSGKFPLKEVPEVPGVSATQIREKLKEETNV